MNKNIMEKTPLEAFNQFKGIKEYYFQKAKEKGGTLRLFGEEDEICAKVENALKTFEKPAVYVARNRGTTKAMIETLKNMPAVQVTCLTDQNKADAFDCLKNMFDISVHKTITGNFMVVGKSEKYYIPISEEKYVILRKALKW